MFAAYFWRTRRKTLSRRSTQMNADGKGSRELTQGTRIGISGKWLASLQGHQLGGGIDTDIGIEFLQFLKFENTRCHRDDWNSDEPSGDDVRRSITDNEHGAGRSNRL